MTALLANNLIANLKAKQQARKKVLYPTKADFIQYMQSRYVQVNSTLVDLKRPDNTPKVKDLEVKMLNSGFFKKDDATLSTLSLVMVDDKEYNPTMPPLWYDEQNDLSFLNTYQQPSKRTLEPSPEFQNIWDDYMALLARDPSERPLLVKWLAHQVQCNTRSKIALLLYGKSTGTGKGTLQMILSELHGDSNSFKPKDSAAFMTGRFTPELEGKTLLILDELYHDGYKVANNAKIMITDDKMDVEPKGKGFRRITAYFDMIAASNKEHPIWLEPTDRRWLCFNVQHDNPLLPPSDPENARSTGVVKAIRSLLEDPDTKENTIAMIRHILLDVDLSDFQPHIGIPHTKDTKSLIVNSGSISEVSFEKAWDSAAPTELYFNADEWFTTHLEGKEISSAAKFNLLTSVGCVQFDPSKDGRPRQMKLCPHDTTKNGSRGWWITPLGFEIGISPEMKVAQIKQTAADYEESLIDDPSLEEMRIPI